MDLQGGGAHIVTNGQNPAWGPDSRHTIVAQDGALYLVDTVTSRKAKILDGIGKITEPSWSH
jgi:hypothetical protein